MSLPQARKFLAQVVPWTPDTYVNLHWRFKSDRDGKPAWTGRAFKSLDAMERAIEFNLKQPNVLDMFVCMSSQKTATEVTSRRGYKYMKAVRGQHNAAELKSFFMDIDVKEGAYENTQAAAKAFDTFIRTTGLPRPTYTVLSGGGGFQSYWVLAESLVLETWSWHAKAFAELAKRSGIVADFQCTIDGARILRIPQTFNSKYVPKRPVALVEAFSSQTQYNLDHFSTALQGYYRGEAGSSFDRLGDVFGGSESPLSRVFQQAAVSQAGATATETDELGAGIEDRTVPPASPEELASACGFVQGALTSGGKELTNPLWNLTTLLATFCDGGRKFAHDMASAHPGYSEASTDELFERKLKDRDEKGLGWPHCSTISGSGAKECQSCPHFAANKTPFHHIHPRVQNTVLLPPLSILPDGYEQKPDGKIYKLSMNEDGGQNSVPVCQYAFKDVWVQSDPWSIHFTYVKETAEGKVSMLFEDIADRSGCRKTMASRGMTLTEPAYKAVQELLLTWTEKLRASRTVTRSASAFGWITEAGKLTGFAYGGHVWTKTDALPSSVPPTQLAKQYSPIGEKQPWLDAMKIITDQKRPALEAIVACAFAAPLVRFTGQPGLMVSAYSPESGIGKSTAMKIAQSVWGHPVTAMQSLNDTQTFIVKKLSDIRSLPIFYDELKTSDDADAFVNTVFKLGQGHDKNRMTASMEYRDAGEWQTMMVLASNENIVEYVTRSLRSKEAGAYRVFEFVVKPGGQSELTNIAVARQIAKLSENFGVIGLEYAKWIGANFDKVDGLIAKTTELLEGECRMHNGERFWAASMAAMLVGAMLANKVVGAGFDCVALKTFLVRSLATLRTTKTDEAPDLTVEENVWDVLARFLNDMRAKNTLMTDHLHLAPGRYRKAVTIRNDPTRIDKVLVRRAEEDKLIAFSQPHFRQWLTENRIPRHEFCQTLLDKYGAREARIALAGDTSLNSGRQRAFILDLNHHKLQGML